MEMAFWGHHSGAAPPMGVAYPDAEFAIAASMRMRGSRRRTHVQDGRDAERRRRTPGPSPAGRQPRGRAGPLSAGDCGAPGLEDDMSFDQLFASVTWP